MITERPYYSLLWFTDPHVASSNPISRKDDYPEAILGKINQVMRIAEKLKVDRIICGGDIFHSKSPSKLQHWTLNRLVKMFKANPPIGIIGNHDQPWTNLSFMDRQPLANLIESGVYESSYEDYFDVQVGTFYIRGINYLEEIPDKYFELPPLTPKIGVLMLHAACTPDGSFPGDEICYSYEYLADRTNATIICVGHYHKDHGVQRVLGKMGAKTIINNGALCRNSRKPEDLNRKPKCTLIRINSEDTNEIEVHEIELTAASDEEIFEQDVPAVSDEVCALQKNPNKFVEELRAEGLGSDDIEALIEKMAQSDIIKKYALRILKDQ